MFSYISVVFNIVQPPTLPETIKTVVVFLVVFWSIGFRILQSIETNGKINKKWMIIRNRDISTKDSTIIS